MSETKELNTHNIERVIDIVQHPSCGIPATEWIVEVRDMALRASAELRELKDDLADETKWACDYSEQVEKLTHELEECRKNVMTSLLKAVSMVDAIRGKCKLEPFDDGYLPEIEEAKQLLSQKEGLAKLAAEHITHCGRYQLDIDEAINIITHALPRIHASKKNDEFCRDVRQWIENKKIRAY